VFSFHRYTCSTLFVLATVCPGNPALLSGVGRIPLQIVKTVRHPGALSALSSLACMI
jgi:hypothetical protein